LSCGTLFSKTGRISWLGRRLSRTERVDESKRGPAHHQPSTLGHQSRLSICALAVRPTDGGERYGPGAGYSRLSFNMRLLVRDCPTYLQNVLLDVQGAPVLQAAIHAGRSIPLAALTVTTIKDHPDVRRRLSTRMRQSGHEISVGAPPRSLGA